MALQVTRVFTEIWTHEELNWVLSNVSARHLKNSVQWWQPRYLLPLITTTNLDFFKNQYWKGRREFLLIILFSFNENLHSLCTAVLFFLLHSESEPVWRRCIWRIGTCSRDNNTRKCTACALSTGSLWPQRTLWFVTGTTEALYTTMCRRCLGTVCTTPLQLCRIAT